MMIKISEKWEINKSNNKQDTDPIDQILKLW